MNILKCVILSATKWSRKISTYALCAILLALFACTDYEAQIDDEYEEWIAEQEENFSELSSSGKVIESDEEDAESSSSQEGRSYSSGRVTEHIEDTSSSSINISEHGEVKSSSSSEYTELIDDTSSSSLMVPPYSVGTITDSRDGRIYKTVTIKGSQTWMAQNLNYETGGSFCYNDSAEYCSKYGRLYTWESAKTSCPSGWYLPRQWEWENLISSVGGASIAGKMLKLESGWISSSSGKDAFRFSALPAGDLILDKGKYYSGEGHIAYFWSSTESSRLNYAYSVLLDDHDNAEIYTSKTNNGLSVRCLRGWVKTTESSSSGTPESNSSQQTGLSSSEIALATPCKIDLIDTCVYGELTDSRDGQAYKTVKIGEQVWMAQNMNYEVVNSYCYNDVVDNCIKYGRLYTWMDAKSVCPNGWHMPRADEWDELFAAVGKLSMEGKVLKSTIGWDSGSSGTDEFGFSALPAGYRDSSGLYNNKGDRAYFWIYFEYNSGNALYLYLSDDLVTESTYDKHYGLSVRCLKD